MNRKTAGIGLRLAVMLIGIALLGSGCTRPEQGPVLAGGREVNSWVKAPNDPRPKVRREAVLEAWKRRRYGPVRGRRAGPGTRRRRFPGPHDAVLAVGEAESSRYDDPGEARADEPER